MLDKLLITGAAGTIGRLVRGRLGRVAKSVRLSDLAEAGDLAAGDLAPGEEFVACELGDADDVARLVEGCDGILHLGGISTENSFRKILNANLVGVHNLYEAARRHGGPRVLFASSNHVIGFYRQDEKLDASAAHRPDGWYGVSKSFGEAVALMYFHKFGIETAMVRIGSCFPEPKDHRMLATWLAPEDFITLVERVFAVPRLGCPVIYGVSDNDAVWWDNSAVDYLGWRPQGSSARFADKVHAAEGLPDRDDARVVYQGGIFTQDPIIEE